MSQSNSYWSNAVRLGFAGAVSAAAVAALLIAPSAFALKTHLSLGTFGNSAQPSFTQATGIAVDQETGDVLVADLGAQTLSRYHEDGTPSDFSALGTNVIDGHPGGEDATPQGELLAKNSPQQVPIIPNEVQIAVDDSGGITDGDIYLTDSRHRVIDVFASTGKYLGQLSESSEGPFGLACGVTVDENGNVFVGDFKGKIHKFTPTANPPLTTDNVANFSMTRPCTLALGTGLSTDSLFAAEYPNEGGQGHVLRLDATTGTQLEVVSAEVNTSISVDPQSGRLFTATGKAIDEYEVGGEEEATLTSSISLGEREALGVAVSAANGDIYATAEGDPKVETYGPFVTLPDATTEAATGVSGAGAILHGTVSADGGPQATCEFEYVEVGAKGFAGATSVPCSPAGPFAGGSPQAVKAELSGLVDGLYRYRLVATNANGTTAGRALAFETSSGLPDGRAYEMVSPPAKLGEVFPPETQGRLNGSCSDCLPGGDITKMPMQVSPDGNSIAYEGQAFSAGTASAANEYLARRSAGGWGTEALSGPEFRAQSPFEGAHGGYVGFSDDLSRGVIMQVEPSLSPEALPNYANLYLWQRGATLNPLIAEAPPHRSPGGSGGNAFLTIFAGANSGTSTSEAFSHVVLEANDALTGPTAFAPEAPEVSPTERNLYEWVDGQLRLVSVLPGNASAVTDGVIGSGWMLVPQGPQNEGRDFDRAISDDGSRIFWSRKSSGQVYLRIDGKETREIPDHTGKYLTAAADGSEVLLSDGHIYGDLDSETPTETDLTAGQGGFEGILGAAEDLSRVYFVDTKALTGAEENENGEEAEEGGFNLYAWHGGSTVFIGRLAAQDNKVPFNYNGAWHPQPAYRTAQVSPDGRYLAFMSVARLTGYDNRQRDDKNCKQGNNTETECSEVFEYAAESGKLICVSCDPTEERPLGKSNLSLITNGDPTTFFPQPHNLTANGRLFFESQDTLSPRETNGNIQDVYQWEPNGVGGCNRPAGCRQLISSGHSPFDSHFVDASPSGNDAFFVTREQLLPRDKDDFLDLYDARAGGGFEENPTPPCGGGEACRGALPAPPGAQSFGSATFSGAGNEAPKHHKPKKHRKHKKHAKRHAKHGRGGSK